MARADIVDWRDEEPTQPKEKQEQESDFESIDSLEKTEPEPERAESPEPEPEQDPEVPEKYKGKSLKEIVRMHQEAEKLIGKNSQEVGELRKLVDEYILRTAQPAAPEAKDEEEEVDFFVDPDKAFNSRIEKHPAIQEAKKTSETLKQERALQALQAKHPDYTEVINNEEFQKWILGSEVRKELFVRADRQFDAAAADELLSTFKAITPKKETKEAPDRSEEARKASTGSARGSAEPKRKKYLRRADLAKLYNEDRERYNALSEEILQAYAEGRVR